jgi:hypothetical protein
MMPGAAVRGSGERVAVAAAAAAAAAWNVGAEKEERK